MSPEPQVASANMLWVQSYWQWCTPSETLVGGGPGGVGGNESAVSTLGVSFSNDISANAVLMGLFLLF